MRRFLLIPLLALAVGVAYADDSPLNVYAGAGIMSSSVDNLGDTGFNLDTTSFKALAGLRFSLLGAEVDYYHLGSESRNFYFGNVNADAHAVAAYAVGYLPLPILDFYGKVGLDRWQLNGSSANSQLFRVSGSGTQLAWGVGAQYHFGSVLGRLEYERLNMSGSGAARIVSLDVAYDFL